MSEFPDTFLEISLRAMEYINNCILDAYVIKGHPLLRKEAKKKRLIIAMDRERFLLNSLPSENALYTWDSSVQI